MPPMMLSQEGSVDKSSMKGGGAASGAEVGSQCYVNYVKLAKEVARM